MEEKLSNMRTKRTKTQNGGHPPDWRMFVHYGYYKSICFSMRYSQLCWIDCENLVNFPWGWDWLWTNLCAKLHVTWVLWFEENSTRLSSHIINKKERPNISWRHRRGVEKITLLGRHPVSSPTVWYVAAMTRTTHYRCVIIVVTHLQLVLGSGEVYKYIIIGAHDNL